MKLGTIVDLLNSSRQYAGTWILQSWVRPHEKFKVYKVFSYKLYFKPDGVRRVSDDDVVLHRMHSDRVEDINLEEKQRANDLWFLSELLSWLVLEGRNYLKKDD